MWSAKEQSLLSKFPIHSTPVSSIVWSFYSSCCPNFSFSCILLITHNFPSTLESVISLNLSQDCVFHLPQGRPCTSLWCLCKLSIPWQSYSLLLFKHFYPTRSYFICRIQKAKRKRCLWSSTSVSPSPSAHCCAGMAVWGALRATAHSSTLFILCFVSFSSSALFCWVVLIVSIYTAFFIFKEQQQFKKPQRNDPPPTPKHHLFSHSCKFVQTHVQTVYYCCQALAVWLYKPFV